MQEFGGLRVVRDKAAQQVAELHALDLLHGGAQRGDVFRQRGGGVRAEIPQVGGEGGEVGSQLAGLDYRPQQDGGEAVGQDQARLGSGTPEVIGVVKWLMATSSGLLEM